MSQYSIPSTTPQIDGNLTVRGSLPTKSLFDANIGTGPGPIQFDGTVLPSSDLRRTEIVDYVRMRLGDGIVDVELEKEQSGRAHV